MVDDEEKIATTLAIILNQAGFEARAVFSGEQVVELLDSFQPEMMIADVVMPGMTGIEVAIAVRSKLPNCKIFFFSGKLPLPICLNRRKRRVTNSRLSLNRYTQPIYLRSWVCPILFTLEPRGRIAGDSEQPIGPRLHKDRRFRRGLPSSPILLLCRSPQ
ncbi:response regulator [Tunturibacter empetritectus]|uniref:response regulator n=1 Tax=Tunturiibacter empetritectus TaxID=3069691 RepID=UPI00359CB75A